MNFWTSLLHNFPLVCAGTGWIVAQIIKVFTGVFKLRKFSIPALLFGNGGMPSSHSASVTALAISCGFCYGFDSGFFAIALMFAIIVMGDAAGVRRETGEQAKILNRITADLFKHSSPEEINRNLKELVGHTPLQVVVGSALGLVIPFLMGLIPIYQAYSPFFA
jgi:acid phosphatase family membrane protein YuiD